jgi:hypothetical protein
VLSGEQISEARQLVGWSPSVLAQRARYRMTTGAIKRAEAGDETALTPEQVRAIVDALARAGVEFTERGDPVRTKPTFAPGKILPIVTGWAAAFGAKTSLEQKHWEVLLLI